MAQVPIAGLVLQTFGVVRSDMASSGLEPSGGEPSGGEPSGGYLSGGYLSGGEASGVEPAAGAVSGLEPSSGVIASVMPLDQPDLLVMGGFTVAVLLVIAMVDRWLSDKSLAPMRIYAISMFYLWGSCLVGCGLWLYSGGALATLGLGTLSPIWQYATVGLGGLAGLYGWVVLRALTPGSDLHVKTAQDVAQAPDMVNIIPRTSRDLKAFMMLAITAGICEEIIFRGIIIGVLSAFMPLVWAALLSVVLFLLAHTYQGPKGMMRIIPITLVLTGLYLASGSVIPGMVVHAIIDIGGGFQLYALRHSVALESGKFGKSVNTHPSDNAESLDYDVSKAV